MPAPNEHEVRAIVARVVDGAFPTAGLPLPREEVAGPPGTPDPSAPIALGADHGGFRMKEMLVFRLKEAGRPVVDCGTHSEDSVDYPHFAFEVARRVAGGECGQGIVVDGAGIGSAMVANKVPGVRAAACWDVSSARNSRRHNHANVLTLGAGLLGRELAWQIVDAWLESPWEGGRHERRVEQIRDVERQAVRS